MPVKKKKHGDRCLKDRQAKTELARINRELKRRKTQIAALAAKEGMSPDEILGRLISLWRNAKR